MGLFLFSLSAFSSFRFMPGLHFSLFIHSCAERFVVTFNLETHVIEFWKVFYYFFDNFLSSMVFILFLEQLLVGVRLLELIL